jgi:hypothetical protein
VNPVRSTLFRLVLRAKNAAAAGNDPSQRAFSHRRTRAHQTRCAPCCGRSTGIELRGSHLVEAGSWNRSRRRKLAVVLNAAPSGARWLFIVRRSAIRHSDRRRSRRVTGKPGSEGSA